MVSLRDKQHLFFDLDDTLWDFQANSSFVLSDLYQQFDLKKKLGVELEVFLSEYHRINLKLWKQLYKREIDKTYLRTQRFNSVLNHFGYENYGESLAISELYLQLAPKGTALKEGCKETLSELQKKYNLHIITNGFAESQHKKIDACGLRPFFKNIIISEEHNSVKPEEKIFRVAESLANTAAQHCVMIGDNYDSDITGAVQGGWEAIHFCEPHNNEHAGIRIHTLPQLLNHF